MDKNKAKNIQIGIGLGLGTIAVVAVAIKLFKVVATKMYPYGDLAHLWDEMETACKAGDCESCEFVDDCEFNEIAEYIRKNNSQR